MIIPSKLYDVLKLICKFIPGFATVVSGLLLTFDVGDVLTNRIVFCITAVGTIAQLFIEACSACHAKVQLEDGTTEEITGDTETEQEAESDS